MGVLNLGAAAAAPAPAKPAGRAGGPLLDARFNLSRWFALVALATISALALAGSVLLAWFISARLLSREAEMTREFVDSLLVVETPLQSYIADPSPALEAEMAVSFKHIAQMPEVLRANVYDRSQRIIWSSDRELIGKQFGRNAELDRALAGEVVVKREAHEQLDAKAEHTALRHAAQPTFIEIYVPVPDPARRRVIGAIEFYKNPQAMAASLAQLRVYIAAGALVGAMLLFLALYGLVRRADRTMRATQRQLVEQSTLAALGQMSGAVAHGIRNPLASIRSSAELIPGADAERASEAAHDIIAQADRLEAWVRELLAYTQPLDPGATPVALPPLLQRCMADYASDFAARRIDARLDVALELPPVRGDAMLLTQVLRCLVTNAMEAMPQGGRLQVRAARGATAGGVTLEVRDSGIGLNPEQLARVGQPFYTTKPRGLGVGLALARRVVEGSGGRLEIESQAGSGTTVRLALRGAGG